MENDFLSLKWNHHSSTYVEMLHQMKQDQCFTDVTLSCDGATVAVHKLVLVTSSNFFSLMLKDTNCRHPIIYLRDIKDTILHLLINFIYCGEVSVSPDKISDFLSAAQTLQIKGLELKNECEEISVNSGKKKYPQEDYTSKGVYSINHIKDKFAAKPTTEEFEKIHPHIPTEKKQKLEFDEKSDFHRQQPYNDYNIHTEVNLYNSKNEHDLRSQIYSSAAFSNIDHVYNSLLTPKSSYSYEMTEDFLKLTPSNDTSTLDMQNLAHDDKNFVEAISSSFMPLHGKNSQDEHFKNLEMVNTTKIKSPPTKRLLNQNSSIESPVNQNNKCIESVVDENKESGISDRRPFECPICHKSFAKLAILKRHHLAHFRPYVCQLCTRSFTRKEVLSEHLLDHKGTDLRLPCPVCRMSIKRKRNLQAHIKTQHPQYYQQMLGNGQKQINSV